MRLSLRFIVPLAIVLALIAYACISLTESLTLRWFVKDLNDHSRVISTGMRAALSPLLSKKTPKNLERAERLLNRIAQDERMYAVALCDATGKLITKTSLFPAEVDCLSDAGKSPVQTLGPSKALLLVTKHPILRADKPLGSVVLVHDMTFVTVRTATTRRYLFFFFVLLGIVVSAVTVLIAQVSLRGWVAGVRALLRGDLGPLSRLKAPRELHPLVKDLRTLVKDLHLNRSVRDPAQLVWSPKKLKEILQTELRGDEILIVSHREPYIHMRQGEKIEVRRPASGLVSALEPVMRACSGTWIAHGTGDADREVVDKDDRVKVPPDSPSYFIRRIWLNEQQESGFYYGFANEGLWPLCHIAHTRPTFRTQDWNQYISVNEKFADAVVEEAKTDDPVVLVQDYHFALLPRMIKRRLPRSTVITFWHIPWPNSESFSICPWRQEILDGLLGSDILGFHTRFHCNNFIDAVDRFLESRIDRDMSTISYGDKVTSVQPYPISIEYPLRNLGDLPPPAECRLRVRDRLGVGPGVLLGIGVDRLDYTKGIVERFRAVERLLELEPAKIGGFSFVQIASPSRTRIDRYQNFGQEVEDLASDINRRFGKKDYKPIHLLVKQHEPSEVYEYYRAADLCVVSSLHDGMNLVAKEFIASRDDEKGVLILSQFTGAARELPEALIVNPYDTDQCAAALHLALEMPEREQRVRMRSMRALIQEFNVYRWAGRMLLDAAKLRRRHQFVRKLAPITMEKPATALS